MAFVHEHLCSRHELIFGNKSRSSSDDSLIFIVRVGIFHGIKKLSLRTDLVQVALTSFVSILLHKPSQLRAVPLLTHTSLSSYL